MPIYTSSKKTKPTTLSKKEDFTMSGLNFNLHLFIRELKYLPTNKVEDCNNSNYVVQIEWRGAKRANFLLKGAVKNYTEKQKIRKSGSICWNEGFDHSCKLKKTRNDIHTNWIINLVIKEIDDSSRGKMATVGKANINVAELVTEDIERNIDVGINCNIKGQAANAVLMIKLHLAEIKTGSNQVLALPRAASLRAFSCTRPPQTNNNNFLYPKQHALKTDTSNAWSDTEESEFHYGKLAITNFIIFNQFNCNHQTKEIHLRQPIDEIKEKHQHPSLIRLLSRNTSKRGPPLLNKQHKDGGDDIDNDRRHQPSIIKQTKVLPEETIQKLKFEDDVKFEVGKWEKRRITSRDGEMELATHVFFASIDQRNDKAAGGGACTVIATIIANWLHENPTILPLRCQFDEIIHEGSSEWRKLCENECHRQKFTDQHFDLETVLETNIRPLEVVTDKSYVSFFSEFVEGVRSFDSVWSELASVDEGEEKVYITSWNDHFFVMKVERDAIYMIDTLGERLFEGCSQAYILRFDKESVVRRKDKACKECEEVGQCEEHSSRGLDSCKEYIKGFLAAIPLKEIQSDLEKGLVEGAVLHRKLQIEFHYMVPFCAKIVQKGGGKNGVNMY